MRDEKLDQMAAEIEAVIRKHAKKEEITFAAIIGTLFLIADDFKEEGRIEMTCCADSFQGKECMCSEKTNEQRSPVERGVSNPVRYGKDYAQFCQFRDQVQRGMNPLMYGDGYIVMSKTSFDEMYNSYLRKGC
jgi:hypothetical protein